MTANNSILNNTVDVQVLTSILINLVTVPEDVKVTRDIDELGVLVSVAVNAQDMGLVIGRNGGMAKAIKTVMTAIGMAHKMRIRVQFLEPDGSHKYSVRSEEDKIEDSTEVVGPSSESVQPSVASSGFDEFALN